MNPQLILLPSGAVICTAQLMMMTKDGKLYFSGAPSWFEPVQLSDPDADAIREWIGRQEREELGG